MSFDQHFETKLIVRLLNINLALVGVINRFDR